MASPVPAMLPTTPVCIPDTTPVCDRVDMLNRMADRDATVEPVQAMASRARSRALTTAPPPGVVDPWDRMLALEAMRVVQAVGYVDTQGERDCYQGAVHTIGHGGECKALSVLFAAVGKSLGLDTEVVWIDQQGAPRNHVAAQVHIAGQPLWADCSVDGAMLGESPYDAIARRDAWHVIGGRPAGYAIRPAGAGVPGGKIDRNRIRREEEAQAWQDWQDQWNRQRWNPPYPSLWPWDGWNTIWYGWPVWWWIQNYPSIYYTYYRPIRPAPYPLYVVGRSGTYSL